MAGRGTRVRKRKNDMNGFEEWGGYMNAKKEKLENQFNSDQEREAAPNDGAKGIFDGVAIFVNGYTDPSADELKRIMMLNGGTFHTYPSKRTTHVIATNLPDSKVKRLIGNEPICHPKWIADSLAAGKLLDFRSFLLYGAITNSQPKINFGATATSPSKAKDANDSSFLGEFYNNSRLHHISTMGANFKKYVAELRDARGGGEGGFPAREELRRQFGQEEFSPFREPVMMHIDMDCFFVSVGLRGRPELAGKPVAVAHARGAKEVSRDVAALRKAERDHYAKKYGGGGGQAAATDDVDPVEFSSMSELASCSYEARAKGVKNGMFLGPALKLCPELKTIPYDFEAYQEVARELYDIVASYTLDIQAVSCDEMLVDVTGVLNEARLPDPLALAEALRKRVREKTGCSASVGMGPNLLLARMATRRAKPDGAFVLRQEEAEAFMRDVPVRDLPGVGRVTANRLLQEFRMETCGQLQGVGLGRLQRDFGPKAGRTLHSFCRGIDGRGLNTEQERKSIGAEVNYGIRFKTGDDCAQFLEQLSAEVGSRMEKAGVRGRCITLKLMVRAENAPKETSKFLGHGICDAASKSANLSLATREALQCMREISLFRHY